MAPSDVNNMSESITDDTKGLGSIPSANGWVGMVEEDVLNSMEGVMMTGVPITPDTPIETSE